MLVSLLIVEIILSVIIILATSMMENKFKGIERSLSLYKNTKAYKTAEHTAFIEKVLERYGEQLEEEEEQVDLNSMIKNFLYKEHIGKFEYVSVKNVALQLENVMWGIIILEIAIGMINNISTASHTIMMVIGSIMLTLGINCYVVIKSIGERAEALTVAVENYVYNVYPHVEKANKQKNSMMNQSIEKRDIININDTKKNDVVNQEIENRDENIQKSTSENMENNRLNAQDIAKFIDKLS